MNLMIAVSNTVSHPKKIEEVLFMKIEIEDGDCVIVLTKDGGVRISTPKATDEEMDVGVTPVNTVISIALMHKFANDKSFTKELLDYAEGIAEAKKKNTVYH